MESYGIGFEMRKREKEIVIKTKDVIIMMPIGRGRACSTFEYQRLERYLSE